MSESSRRDEVMQARANDGGDEVVTSKRPPDAWPAAMGSGDGAAVLMVDDHEENLIALEATLEPLGLRLVKAASGALALKALLRDTFAVILLDVTMPEMDGFETAEIIKTRDRTKHTPIIFMTAALTDVAGAMRGYQVGAVDFMMKPLDPDVVRAKVSVFVELYRRGEQIRRQGQLLQDAERRQRALELAELRRSVERRYNNLADSVPQLIARARADGELDYVNRRFAEYTGVAFEQSIASGWKRALHPNDADRFLAQWHHAVSAGEPLRAELRLRSDSGSYRWFLCEGLPERGDGKTVLAFLAGFTDVTEQKRIEDERATALHREHAARLELELGLGRLDLLVEASRVLAESLDPAAVLGRLASVVAPRFATWCVIDRALPGGTFEQAAFAHGDPTFATAGADLGRTGVALDAESRVAALLAGGRAELVVKTDPAELAHAIGTHRVDLVERFGATSYISAPLRARGEILGVITFVSAATDRAYGAADLALGIDLAQRAALAIDNARLYTESQEAIRLREEFLSIASHELRTPLSALQLQMQSLDINVKKANLDPARLQSKLVIAQRQVDRLTRLISELLDVSRIQAGRLDLDREEIDVVEVVRDVVARFSGEIERSSTPLTLDLQGPIVGSFDRLRVDQIVTNLLHNAIKYGRGQPVAVSAIAEEGQVQISASWITASGSRRSTSVASSAGSSARSRRARTAGWASGSTSSTRSSGPTAAASRSRARSVEARASRSSCRSRTRHGVDRPIRRPGARGVPAGPRHRVERLTPSREGRFTRGGFRSDNGGMRSTFALASFAILLAGCSAGSHSASGGGFGGAGGGGADGGGANVGGLGSGGSDGGFNPTGGLTGGGAPAGPAQVFAESPNTLFTLDPDTKAFSKVGDFQGCNGVIDIALDKDGVMYATTSNGLWNINPQTAACTHISTGNYPNSLSLVPKGTVDPNEEALVGYNGAIYVRIDKTTGAVSQIGSLGNNGYASSGDIVSVIGGGTYLTVNGNDCNDCIIQVNPTTGAMMNMIGHLDHQSVFGLAFWAGAAYGFDDTGNLFQIDLTNGMTTAIPKAGLDVMQFWGAGSTTSAPVVPK